ncbi:467_t:CDS:2 [Cetraspora pellucida]|uniref:467_t:CDS:1 n=1 Tax=Cetraspora pellucida TaxID=1433469 RepID=A0ACA9LT84_9GLOM|nr:467_t:CDS:2 [Cetraspora pellucida]
MHTNKGKQKECIPEEVELEEIESFPSDNILTDDKGPKELENKFVKIESLAAPTNKNPTVEEQLNKIEKNRNLEEYQESVK